MCERTDERKEQIGQDLISILRLRLRLRDNGTVSTEWGCKTPLGLYSLIEHVMTTGVQTGEEVNP